MARASKLVKDLQNVPSIVGGLGLSIAEAQKAFNLDYLENLQRILVLIKAMLAPEKAVGSGGAAGGSTERNLTQDEKNQLEDAAAQIKELLGQLAPPRYQFTETTLQVKLDLAQTMDLGAEVGFGAGFGAVAVNAALAIGFGSDYRAAAEVKSVIHAIPASTDAFNALLGRADKLHAKDLVMPAGASVDAQVVTQTHEIVKTLSGVDLKKPTARAKDET